ncbi:MAG: DUF1844 domain-containing protein [Deltaproteobacteria bacterium]|nr:DUF1844 domain-containing protein [Deltaproteobacteria bacterium]
MADDEQQAAFKVEDRRRFDAAGQPREAGEEPGTAGETCSGDATCQSGGTCEGTDQGAGATGAAEGRKNELTFSSFVVGLATQALMFMGAMPAPSGQQIERNLGEASVIIDILSMLERKTAGNLAEDEARLIEDILYDLRMRFVRETRAKAEQGSQSA